jgi:predicted dienelactone hydrolase
MLLFLFLDPRVPAFEGAPLYQHNSKQDTGITTSNKASSRPDLSTEHEEGEMAGENDTSKEEGQQQSDQSAEEEQTTTAPPSATSEAFPVIVFSHGLASMRTICSGICSDLASQGFVVAAVEHRCVQYYS